uniref:Uncharacterized protein n=1 Tax=Amicula sp. isolate GU52X-4 cfCalB7 TaxID=3003489 RepID=A0A9E8Z2F2_9STRA|nr:hypothetical protein [Amicula sp. isolate GU52X-4 cfCalB7]WAK84982.1 hypothetical protein [Amicula sp. isolate GU52X-4 cfCalB7]
MTNIKYNLKRHIELLNKEKKVLTENKSFCRENRKEALELSKYSSYVSQHIEWKDRFGITSVMQDFLSKKIGAHEFHDSVFGLRRKHLDKCDRFLEKLASEEIKDFCPSENAHKLKGLLSALYFECEHFETNFDEAELYDSIANGFLNVQNFFIFYPNH